MGRFVGAGEWPLIGRSQELHLINSCFDGPSRFAGVAIIGPPGVGKSRLVAEAAASAGNAGAEVRWTVATESARSIPLGAFLPWASGISGNPLRLVSTVIDALATTAHGKPAVIAVDDAHLLDDLSAFVLHQLVLRGAGRVIVSIRTGEPTPDAVTALWKDRHLRLLELQPLSRPESDALLRSALGGPVDDECARRMWHLTNGNVLYLRHVVEQELTARRLCREGNDRWGWQGTPVVSQTLVGLIASHIGSVSEAILDVVDLVAIAEPLEMKILDQLVDPAACDDAERRGLIAVSQAAGGVVASIGHPLYGEARRNQAGPLHLRRLRGRVAAALAAAGSMDHADVVRLGVLWLESDLAPDPELLLRAAQAAMVRLDLALSERLAGASLRAGGGTDAAILRSHALNLLNRSQDAEDLLASLDLEGVTDAQASSIVIVRAANFLWPLARPSDSWDLVETALRRSNPAVRQSLLPMRLVQLAFAARPVEAVAAAESLDLGQLSDLPALVAAWAMVTALGDVGSASKATAVAIEAYERASQSIDAAYQGVGLVEFHVAALLSAGRVTDAVAVAADARRHCADVPGVVSAVTTAVAGMAALGTGRLDLARH